MEEDKSITEKYLDFIWKTYKDARESLKSKKEVKTKMIYGMEVVVSKA